MADSAAAELLHHSSSKNQQVSVDSRLHADIPQSGNIIHKITSETLRLTEPQYLQHQQTGLSSITDKKKTSSFQITSVTVSSSVSNDGEDDSCGEVEDSHTDFLEQGDSQRQMDYQVFLDGGLYDADSGLSVTSIGVPVSLAQQVNEGVSLKAEDKDHGWQGRFRVVKIESSEPFKRGRWLCMDFLDHPSIQTSLSREEPGSGASSTASLSDHGINLPNEEMMPSSSLHQPPVPVLPQAVSSITLTNSSNQTTSSNIHLAPHSLPASAAAINYSVSQPLPPVQQPNVQQQVYQQQGLPVYPASSMAPILQPTTGNSASISMSGLSSQPASAPTAPLPVLSSNVGQPFVQQPNAAVHSTGQQQPATSVVSIVPPSSVGIQQPTYGVQAVPQQYVPVQQHIVPQQVQMVLPQHQPINSVPSQSIPQQPIVSSAGVQHVIPPPIIHQQQPLLVQPQQTVNQSLMNQPQQTVNQPVINQPQPLLMQQPSGVQLPVILPPGTVQHPVTIQTQTSTVQPPAAVPQSTAVQQQPTIQSQQNTIQQPNTLQQTGTFPQQPIPPPSGTLHQGGLVQHGALSQSTNVTQQSAGVHQAGMVQQLGHPPSQTTSIPSNATMSQHLGQMQQPSLVQQPSGAIQQPPVPISQHPVPIQTTGPVQPSGTVLQQSGTIPQSGGTVQQQGTVQQPPIAHSGPVQQTGSLQSASGVSQLTQSGAVPQPNVPIPQPSAVQQTATLQPPSGSTTQQSSTLQSASNMQSTSTMQQNAPPLQQAATISPQAVHLPQSNTVQQPGGVIQQSGSMQQTITVQQQGAIHSQLGVIQQGSTIQSTPNLPQSSVQPQQGQVQQPIPGGQSIYVQQPIIPFGNQQPVVLPTVQGAVSKPLLSQHTSVPATVPAVVVSNPNIDSGAVSAPSKGHNVTEDVHASGEDHASSSGTSTVAIDNKIEQAMDLVKSHLMFAVREEVEVLKERIAELMERIALLESENSILRAAATQETLTQLSQLESTYHHNSGDNGSASGSNNLQGQNGPSGP